jgi:hypothetical protein
MDASVSLLTIATAIAPERGTLHRSFRMMTLTGRERILQLLRGEPIGRFPRDGAAGNRDTQSRASIDKSADRWNDFVGAGKAFYFISKAVADAPPW